MKRTAEKVLSIISAAFTTIAVILSFMGLSFLKTVTTDEALRLDFEKELLSDPTMPEIDPEMITAFFNLVEGFSWLIIIGLIISLLVTIIGIVFIWNNKKPKLAGFLFIVGGLFAGIISLTSILLYVAGILCFARKPPMSSSDENPFTAENYDGTMRPL